MKKITAVQRLLYGEYKYITDGTSKFILQEGNIINKDTGEALDMQNMLDEGWEGKKESRWDEPLLHGGLRPTLCVIERTGGYAIVVSLNKQGKYYTSCGYALDEPIRPATEEEALSLVADSLRTKVQPKEPSRARKKLIREEREEQCEKEPSRARKKAIREETEEQCEQEDISPSKKADDLKKQYVGLGLNGRLWDDFLKYCNERHVDMEKTLRDGMASATCLIIDFSSDRINKIRNKSK